MKKVILLFLVTSFVLLFTGCATVDIICSVDNNNQASMTIAVTIPRDELDEIDERLISISLIELYHYWQDAGWNVQYNNPTEKFELVAMISVEANDTKSAFYELLNIMSLDISPFSSVDGGYSSSFFSDIYSIKAEMDLSQMLDFNYIETFPPTQQERIESALKAFTGTIIFDMPGSATEFEGELDGKIVSSNFSLDTPVVISRITEKESFQNNSTYEKLQRQIELHKQNLFLFGGILGGLVLVFIIVIVLLIKSAKERKA